MYGGHTARHLQPRPRAGWASIADADVFLGAWGSRALQTIETEHGARIAQIGPHVMLRAAGGADLAVRILDGDPRAPDVAARDDANDAAVRERRQTSDAI